MTFLICHVVFGSPWSPLWSEGVHLNLSLKIYLNIWHMLLQ